MDNPSRETFWPSKSIDEKPTKHLAGDNVIPAAAMAPRTQSRCSR